MSVKLADTLAPMSEFPVAEAKDVDINIDGTHKDLQTAYEDGDLGGGSDIQVELMPSASAEYADKVLQFVGTSGTYINGYFYKCVEDSGSYSWVQTNTQPSHATADDVEYDNTVSGLSATDTQEAIDEIVGGLGTASGKDFTDEVRPNSHDLVESVAVYSAINNALSTIYVPRGDLACSQLTSALLIADNVGNVYQMSDSGYTSSLFINGSGILISAGDNVGIIKAGADDILFNYMGNAFDLHDCQKKDLTTAVEGQTTVEGALGALSTNKADKTDITYKNKSLTTTSIDDFGATLVANGVGSYSGTVSVNGTWYNYQSTIQGNLSGSWYGNAILWGDSGNFYTFRKSYSASTTWTQKKFVTDEIIPSNASASNKLLSYKSTQLYANYQSDITRVVRIEYPSNLATRLHLITEPGLALRDVFIQVVTRTPFVTVYNMGVSSSFTIKTADVSNKRVVYINVGTSDGSVIINQDDIPTDGYGNLQLPTVTVTNTSDEEWTSATAITPKKLVTESDLNPVAITTPTPVSGVTGGDDLIYGFKSGKMVTIVLNGIKIANNITQNQSIFTNVPTAVGNKNIYFTVLDYENGKLAVMSIIGDSLAAAFQSDDKGAIHAGRYWGTVTYMTSD